MTALFFVLFFGTMLLLGMPLFASITITVAAMPLFFAGNCGFTLIVYAYLYCRKHGNGDQAVIDAHNDALRSRPFSAVLKESIWALICPVIILGGIFAGITDTSQAAAISLIYAIFVSVCIYKSVTLAEVVEIIKGSLSSAAPLCILLAIANIFSGALGAMKVPDQMAETLVNAGFPHMLLVGLLLLVMLVLGTFMDSGAAMRILVPLVYPVLLRLGMEPYSFVVAVIMTQAIGLTTPPYGLCLFVMAPVSGESMTSLSKGIIPLVLILIAVAYLFGLFPGLLGWALPG